MLAREHLLEHLKQRTIATFDIDPAVEKPECWPQWPQDPGLTLAQQDSVFDAAYACMEQ